MAYISIAHFWSIVEEKNVLMPAFKAASLGYFGEDDLPEGPSSVPMVFFFAKGHSIMMHRLKPSSIFWKKYSISLTSYYYLMPFSAFLYKNK